MLINPSLHNFLENTIFDFQITIDTVHPVQISSSSDNCITQSLKNRGLVPNIQPDTDFS